LPVEIVQQAEIFRHNDEGIFPDNWQIVNLFTDIMTQWRAGPTGVIGLDHNVLPMWMRVRKIGPEDEADVLEGIKVMERSALKALRER